MAKLLKLRRGTTSQHSSFTGAEGEVTIDTTKDTAVVHDGSQAGGRPLAREDMSNVSSASIAGQLGTDSIAVTKIAAGTLPSDVKVNSANITDGSIVNSDINGSANIANSKLADSGVTAGSVGSSSAIPVITVNSKGIITGTSTTAIDSTTIANGTSNVAVANNGNITTTRSGTARLVVDDAGVDITGTLDVSANAAIFGSLTMSSTNPKVVFTDTDHNPDFSLQSNSGSFAIHDETNSTNRLQVNSDGHVDVTGNLDVSAGLDVTGNITVTGTVDGADVAAMNTKLSGIESGATADQTAAEILTAIKTVDGAGSGLDADTLDGISSGNFVRSDQGDTMGGQYTISTAANEKLTLSGSSSPFIRFEEGTTDKAYIQWDAGAGEFILVNQETNDYFRIGSGSNGLKYSYDGSNATVWHTGNDGSGSGLDADTVDGIQASNFLRSDQADTASGDITFSGGAGAATIGGGSDLRFSSGSWTGESMKIQGNSNYLYIQSGSNGTIFRRLNGADAWLIENGGHFRPMSNNTYDIGTSSNRVRNIYTNDLHLSNNGSSNDMDGTWGDWTIQEGESDLFLKNNRSGKKYKFNLTEVS